MLEVENGDEYAVPFFLFAFLFLILPTMFLVIGAFQDADGHFTLLNLGKLYDPTIINAFRISLEISAASAIAGAAIGFFLAYAVVLGGLPRWLSGSSSAMDSIWLRS